MWAAKRKVFCNGLGLMLSKAIQEVTLDKVFPDYKDLLYNLRCYCYVKLRERVAPVWRD